MRKINELALQASAQNVDDLREAQELILSRVQKLERNLRYLAAGLKELSH